ncbi:MAG: DEAD/DEAH box helicase family protein [Deltaproteobacteria bacterium]|nr:DEAD/DEAH box helicase family protein [Deltaproteobacteria bacterium]
MATKLNLGAATEPRYAGKVVASWELQRIEKLPRRILDLNDIPDLSPLFVRERSPYRLWPIQSAALIEAAAQNGLFAPIRAGAGKTLIGLLLPEALDSDCAVYLVKPSLKRQLIRELDEFYCKHFLIPRDRLHIVSYHELSDAETDDILDELNPDAIIADEAHCLKNPKSVRTGRFLRFMEEHPQCRFAGMSGTMTTRSLKEYSHLAELALHKNSPVPKSYQELRAWSGALDAKPAELFEPGALLRFCNEDETPRQGFHRRLVETPGVVGTSEAETGSSLLMRPIQIKIPSQITEMIADLLHTWKLVDEAHDFIDEITEATVLAAYRRQLSSGFYYVWDWPNTGIDREWMTARANWNREVREKRKRPVAGMDSPLLLERAAERMHKWVEEGSKPPQPAKCWDSAYWPEWRLFKDQPKPPTIPVWIDDFIVRASIVWAKKQDKKAIIWYEHRAVGEALAKHFPFYGPGADADLATEPVIVCSIEAQGTGKNLQHQYSRNLFTSFAPSGSKLEQLMARTHRPGQPEDEVICDYFQHTCTESLERIMDDDAPYVQESMGQLQRVFYATHLDLISLKY